MKAICIRQPFAWLVFHGKPVENRIRRSKHRGPLVIIASKGMARKEYEGAKLFVAGFDRDLAARIPPRQKLVFGAALGTVQMVDCVEAHPSPFFCGPWGHVYENAKLFPEPIPVERGQLGIFEWDRKGALCLSR